MAKATKLPSGNWRVRVCIGRGADGKYKYRSFTGSDKKKVLYEASLYQIEYKEEKTRKSLKAAIADYIESKEAILSPSTIRSYLTMQKMLDKNYSEFVSIPLDKLKSEDVQKVINAISKKRTPKTVRNYSGFIYSVLDFNNIILKKWTLPKKVRPELNIPDDDVIKQILELAKDTELYIPILLAAFCTMRRGEICALQISDINGNIIHICKSIVKGPDKKYHEKSPKSFAGDRFIDCPAFIIDAIKKQGYVTSYKPVSLTNAFSVFLKNNNIKKFRFHDLRHYSASALHALNVPDSYIMQRGGWSSDGTLKNVYRHSFEKKSKEEFAKANDYFSKLIE